MGLRILRPVAWLALVAPLLILGACRAKTAQEYLAQGMAEMKKQNYAKARVEFANAIKEDTLLAESYYQAAVAAQEMRDFSSAYESLLVAEQRDRKPANEYYSLDLRLRLGLMMLYGRDYQSARTRAQWVLQRDPGNVKAHELMAFIFSALAQPQFATTELDDVLSAEPRDLQARMMSASLHFAASETEESIHQMQLGVEQTGHSPESLLALGNLYQVAGQPEKSAPLYQEAIAANPKNTNAYVGLGWLYARIGNRPKAEETFREVGKLVPGDPDALMALGNFYMNQLELPAAIRELERVTALSKASAIHTRLAGAYYLAGQYDNAEKTVRRVIAADSQNVDARLLLGMLYLRTGRNNESVAEFTNVLHTRSDFAAAHFFLGVSLYNAHNETVAVQEMETALRLDPFMIAARVWHAELLLLRDSPNGALAVLRDAPESQKDLPVVRLLRALCSQGMKNDLQAMEEVRGLLAVDPKMIAGFYSMGFGRLLDKHIELAKQALELGLKADPGSLEILQVLARNFVVEGQTDQAVNRVRAQMKLIKPTVDHYLLLGDVYRIGGQYGPAREAFTVALSMAPDRPAPLVGSLETDLADGRLDSARGYAERLTSRWPRSTLAWTWQGVVMEGLRKNLEAQRCYERALDIDPNQPVAAHNLARRIMVDGGDLAQALNWATRAHDLQPFNATIDDTLGWIYYKHGSWHFAEVQAQAAVRIQPRNASFLYHLGAILDEEGHDKEAISALREALRIDPKLPEAVDAQKRIDDIKERLTGN
jgi:tetratricopeptide (TPR) repeat protein